MLKFFLILFLFIYTNIRSQSLFEESNKKAVDLNDVVATIGTLKITAGEFFYSYEYGPAFAKREKSSKNIYLKYMINEKLLALCGYEDKLLGKDEVRSMFNEIKADLATEEMFKDEILSRVKISDDELNAGIVRKQITIKLKWLYTSTEKQIIDYQKQLGKGIKFDILFNSQLNDSVFANDREMKTTEFDLAKKNPLLGEIISKLKPGEISHPFKVVDGWYIIKYDNKWLNMLITETEHDKIKDEVNEVLLDTKSDSLSDIYVNKLMLKENPVIQRDVADVLKYYIAEYILPAELNKKWEIGKKLDSVLTKLGFNRNDNYKGLVLAKGEKTNFTLTEFLTWFWNRDQYFKIPQDNFLDYSFALEKIIWQMVRDKILTRRAKEWGYFDSSWVKLQSGWWKDKIAYSAERNKLSNSVLLTYEQRGMPPKLKESKDDYLSGELNKKILHKLIALKKEHKVNINQNVLDKIKVSTENEPKSIDVYYVKKGSLIPRNPFPTINIEWAGWE
jgi:hypothetical protein